jgi:ribosomal protein S6E (S10)
MAVTGNEGFGKMKVLGRKDSGWGAVRTGNKKKCFRGNITSGNHIIFLKFGLAGIYKIWVIADFRMN